MADRDLDWSEVTRRLSKVGGAPPELVEIFRMVVDRAAPAERYFQVVCVPESGGSSVRRLSTPEEVVRLLREAAGTPTEHYVSQYGTVSGPALILGNLTLLLPDGGSYDLRPVSPPDPIERGVIPKEAAYTAEELEALEAEAGAESGGDPPADPGAAGPGDGGAGAGPIAPAPEPEAA